MHIHTHTHTTYTHTTQTDRQTDRHTHTTQTGACIHTCKNSTQNTDMEWWTHQWSVCLPWPAADTARPSPCKSPGRDRVWTESSPLPPSHLAASSFISHCGSFPSITHTTSLCRYLSEMTITYLSLLPSQKNTDLFLVLFLSPPLSVSPEYGLKPRHRMAQSQSIRNTPA